MEKQSVKDLIKKMSEAKDDFNSKIVEKLKSEKIEVNIGAGFFIIKANAYSDIQEVFIDDEVFQIKDKEMLQDMIKSGINELNDRIGTIYNKVVNEQSTEKLNDILKESGFGVEIEKSVNKKEK